MPARRSRSRKGARRRVRRHAVARIPRAKTSVVNCVFELEKIYGSILVPGASTFGGYNTINYNLPAYTNNSGGNQAVMYSFSFSLNYLNAQGNNYPYVQQLYDFVKLKKVVVRLKSNVKPQETIQTAALSGSASYDFNTFPANDPVLTYCDYDGWQPMIRVGATGAIPSPSNGDMTQYLNNKPGIRRHNPWGTIKRTFYPRSMMLIATDSASGPSTTPTGMLGKRTGWLTSGTANQWTGNLIMAVPYLGTPDAGNVNYQPMFSWTISNLWHVAFKTPLYG
jgi:hypothetical protein